MKTDEFELATVPIKHIEPNPLLMRGVDLEGEQFQALQRSIARFGILQPILLQPIAEDANGNMKYAVTNGMQRYTACKNLGKEVIPAQIQRSNEIESLVKQITTNSRIVVTKRAEYGHALKMIIARQPACTLQDLAHMTGESVEWVKTTLSLTRLTPAVAEYLHINNAPIANQLKLVEIPDNDQDNYKEQACTMGAAEFAGIVKAYKKAVADARKGLPKPELVYEPTAHIRAKKELEEALANPPHVDGHVLDKNTLKWVLSLDAVSIATGKAKFEAAKLEREEKAAKAKAEREKSKLLAGGSV